MIRVSKSECQLLVFLFKHSFWSHFITHVSKANNQINYFSSKLLYHVSVEGIFTEWTEWSSCSHSCGRGSMQRNRTCIGPFFGGLDCHGPYHESTYCNPSSCPGIMVSVNHTHVLPCPVTFCETWHFSPHLYFWCLLLCGVLPRCVYRWYKGALMIQQFKIICWGF